MSVASPYRRRYLQWGSAATLLAVLPQLSLAASTDTVRRLQGELWINDQPAQLGSPVKVGDVLRTGSDSSAQVVLGKDAYLLRAHTRLQLTPASDDGLVVGVLRLFSGGVLASFGRGNKTLRTPTLTAGIRGTGIYMETQPGGTYFCTCYGQVELTDLQGNRRWISSAHHQSVLSDQGMQDATLLNHTDHELIELDALQGRTPPFVAKPS
ncbi:FecR domain-containing protein [Leeia aquatica]|uniref:FecR domain-containing protein n=1 Tax=Leeia aquatica TaxID=2725557 RepID=A0A847S4Z0_9NEIS|nr:FecR domain-containing protein [Leeia aquatica]NLR74853.1 FecR domain-containing protein [Leeia aquatica]